MFRQSGTLSRARSCSLLTLLSSDDGELPLLYPLYLVPEREMALRACRSIVFNNSRRYISCMTGPVGEDQSPQVRVFRPAMRVIPQVYPVREMAKKTKNKPDKKKEQKFDVDDLIESEDVDLDENEGFEQAFKETELSKLLSQKTKGKKTKGSVNMKYEEFVGTVNAEALWQELQEHIESLKHCYLHQFSVRSATSLGRINFSI